MVIGTPGTVAPARVSSGVSMRARYQSPGARNPRWGSLARIGLPVSVRDPATAQTLDAVTGAMAAGQFPRIAENDDASPSAAIVGGASPATPGQSSSIRPAGKTSSRPARSASAREFPDSRIPMSRAQTRESAGRHFSGVENVSASSTETRPECVSR